MGEGFADRVASILAIVANGVVVAGFLLAIAGFVSSQRQETKRFTVNYSDAYYSEDVLQSRLFIRSEIGKIRQIDPSATVATIAEGLRIIVQKDFEGELAQSIVTVGDYFNRLHACVEAGICDNELVNTLHSGEGVSLSCLIVPALTAIDLGSDPSMLAAGMKSLGATC